MKILYYSWGEITKEDAVDTLTELGHEVDLLEYDLKDYNLDSAFSRLFLEKADGGSYDMIFSFNFVPLVAKLAFARKLRYVSWIFDAMPSTLYSVMAFSPYNYIFTFDGTDCEILKKRGIPHVFHLPLGFNDKRIGGVLSETGQDLKELHNITFIGTLYKSKQNFDAMEYLPDNVKAHVKYFIEEQFKEPGNEYIKKMCDSELVKELDRHVTFELSDEYTWSHRDIYLDMILKKSAAMERSRILKCLAEKFGMDLYSSDVTSLPGITGHEYIDYNTVMPLVVARSKINLHITPRAITSGMSLRIFDIMGAGGFLLSNAQPELLEYFHEGRDFVAYRNEEDLMEKVSYYLEHEDERREIAANGQRKVNENFTYRIRFGKMFDALERLG